MRSSFWTYRGLLARYLLAVIGLGISVSCLNAVDARLGHVGKDATAKTPHHVTIPQIADNLSGVTWSPRTGTLFAITNSPQAIYELEVGGTILRRIALEGFNDTEDIAYLEDNSFALVEERTGMVRLLQIDTHTRSLHVGQTRGIDLGTRHPDNKGYESLCFDASTRTLFTMQEHPPFELVSVLLDKSGATRSIRREPVTFRLEDVAGLHRDKSGTLWVLSEASSCLIRLDENRRENLRMPLPQFGRSFRPEGLTQTPDGRFLIVGEPNILALYSISP